MGATAPDAIQTCELLEQGKVEVLGLLPYSSNYVFLARVDGGEEKALAVYKPTRGERPLWDFPPGTLAAREVAAFEVSEAAGWGVVPATVLRDDAPIGPGSLQLFIEHDPDAHYFTLAEQRLHEFEVFAALDVVINNADRKAGHVIEDAGGRLWGVDHGLSFNVVTKLRTVIWAFAGDRIGREARAGVETLRGQLEESDALRKRLSDLLSDDEARATSLRVERLLAEGTYPCPETTHHLPWPLV